MTDFLKWLDTLKTAGKAATPGEWGPCLGSGGCECTAIKGEEPGGKTLLVCDLVPDWMLEDAHKEALSYKPANMEFISLSKNSWDDMIHNQRAMFEALTDMGVPRMRWIDEEGWSAADVSRFIERSRQALSSLKGGGG